MPTGKRVVLTSRDLAIFRRLEEYRYLPSTYLHDFVGGASETRFKERLGDLFHEGFIDRPDRQWEFVDARSKPVVYEIGKRAREALRESGREDSIARTYLGASAHRQFAHSVLICECLASIELAAAAHTALRFIPWGEILARAPEHTISSRLPFQIPTKEGGIIPDAMFGLEYGGEGARKSYRFFALEVDRGTMPVARRGNDQTSYVGKLAGYDEIIGNNLPKIHLGIPNLFVLTATTSEMRLVEIARRIGPGRPLFLLKALDENCIRIPQSSLLDTAWGRAQLTPLHIAEN